MKEKKIKMLLMAVDFDPEEAEGTVEDLQRYIHGKFGFHPISKTLSLVYDEAGLQTGKQYNRCGMVGNLAIVKTSAAGNIISLTEADLQTALDWQGENEHRPPMCECGKDGNVTQFCPCSSILIFCKQCYDNCFTDVRMKPRCHCQKCRGKKIYPSIDD